MGWLRRWLRGDGGSRSPGSAEDGGAPAELPGGVLAYVRSIGTHGGPVRCWTFVTRSLAEHGQQELAITYAPEAREAFHDVARQVVAYVDTVRSFAKQGRIVEAGGATVARKPFLFGARAVLYLPPAPLEDVEMTSPWLSVVPLFGDEAEAWMRFGAPRIAGRLGRHFREYPFPPYCVGGRGVIAACAGDDASLLWKVPHETFPALRARVDAGPRGERRAILRLRLLPAEGDRLCAALGEVPDDAVVAIVPGLDAEADSLLTWVPGQKGLEAIGPDGSPGRRTGLCFVALARSAPRDEWKETEDGVALLLTAAGWARLRQALLDHAPLDLRMEDGRSLALSWTMGGYVSPIDGQVFGVGGDWSCYRRGEPTDGGDALPAEPPEPGPGGSMDVVLLTPTSLLVQRTTEADLGAYLQRVEAVIRRQIGRDPAVRLHVRIVLEPRQRVSVSTACEPRDLDERVSEAVGCLTPVPEVTGEVALELVCPGRSRPA